MNDQNNRVMVAELKAEYIEYIMGKVNSVTNLCEFKFSLEHNLAKKIALDEFESRRNLPNSYNQDVYKSDLIQVLTLLIHTITSYLLKLYQEKEKPKKGEIGRPLPLQICISFK